MTAYRGRWFAAILLQYNLRDPFLDRDAGLFQQGLKANGVDSRFVAIGNPSEHQHPALVLGSLPDLENPQWWRQWHLEGVVLYSWALPQFTRVAAAIKAAGIRLVLILDSDGYVAPHVSTWIYLRNKFYREKEAEVAFPSMRALAKAIGGAMKSRHAGILGHLEFADVLALPSSMAGQRYARYLHWLGRGDLARRIATVPYPVSEKMRFDPSVPKEPTIVSVGGWGRLQKNAPLLVKVLGAVLQDRKDWSALVVGPGREVIENLSSGWPKPLKSRLHILGPVANDELPKIFQQSRISLCTSFHESFHLATAEALCCGCSFVGDARISSMTYFASLGGSGTVACDLAERHLKDALFAEIELWETGRRDPVAISNLWTGLLHPENAARRILEITNREA